jgi:hypothetical protein
LAPDDRLNEKNRVESLETEELLNSFSTRLKLSRGGSLAHRRPFPEARNPAFEASAPVIVLI